MILYLCLTFFLAAYAKDYSNRGFDKNIDWVDFSEAQALALKEHKPIFLLITHSWCHACQSMKFDLKNDTRKPIFLELTKNFVMVNLEDKEEPEDKKYAPDGVYTPRLFFMDPNLNIMPVHSKYDGYHKFFFPYMHHMIDGMKEALTHFGFKLPATDRIHSDKVEQKETHKSDHFHRRI